MTETEIAFAPPSYPSLAAALAAFQSKRPSLTASAEADVQGKEGKKGYKYKYAELADVEELALPALGAVGLSFCSTTTFHGNAFVLVCSLMHESGESRESVFPLPNANNPQALGSAMTYFARYALMKMVGLAAKGDDDDGATATHAGRERFEDATPAPRQERRSPGPGTRQGSADGLARELLSAPLERLPDLWRNVEAGGYASNKPTADGAKAIRDHLSAAEIPKDSLPGQLLGWATGPLAQIAGFRLLLEGWTAEQFFSAAKAAEADKTYMALCQIQTNFGKLFVTPDQRLGDWLALNAAKLHRERNSDPEQTSTPPWEHSTSPNTPHDVEMAQGSGYDADDAEDNDTGRPAVLEG